MRHPQTIPRDDFAVVMDTEREHIVSSGPYLEMVGDADMFNIKFQTTNYEVVRWDANRIY